MKKRRVCVVYLLFLCIVTILCARLYVIAGNGSAAGRVLAGQYTRKIDIVSRRGFVFDRNGALLDVEPDGYVLFADPAEIDPAQYDALSETLSAAAEQRQSYFLDRLYSGQPFVVSASNEVKADGVSCYPRYKEAEGDFLCHLLGYGDADGNGVAGVRRAYSDYLNRETAAQVYARYRADASGASMDASTQLLFDSGYLRRDGIYLTIDETIQKIVEDVCRENLDMGAVVVLGIDDGEIYAMLSKPGYRRGHVADFLNSERGELLNRCLMGYTPGSVFKTAVAAAALEKDPSALETVYECKGYIDVGGERIRCHNTAGHGALNMKEAFAQSCNPYFIQLGLSLGLREIIDSAQRLGARAYASINLLPTSSGNFPEEKSPPPALVANTSVGQGALLLTPVQVCSMIASAESGIYHKPTFVKRFASAGGTTDCPPEEGERVLRDETAALMRTLFESCVLDGTGFRARSEITAIGGKTATAQSGQRKDDAEVIHAWFAGYFPADAPQFAMCILCDGNGAQQENPAILFRSIAEEIVRVRSE